LKEATLLSCLISPLYKDPYSPSIIDVISGLNTAFGKLYPKKVDPG
jgi:hypothetical protein